MAAASDFNPFQSPPKGDNMFAQITDNVTRIMEAPKPPRAWYIAFGIALSMLTMFLGSITWAAWTGIGVWGNMMPVAWAFPIVNFVFWIGIGHAGTLISAILFLLRQNWRTAINRFAEAMTIFAVMCAGIFPGVHIGRPWLPYYMMPIPNQMDMWPQYRSPLEWDIFAVSTYATVSILFWYMGMIPDFATFRDRSTSTAKRVAYGIVAMGWRGSSRQWHRYERAYLILAALAT
ncbi:MAG TPA: NrfD/PsrC family molybdoenzyme membrane anchor subunit, partial [Steroidobacteraceae bacterium]|nr:NrfD/PsrC family molybdoenzyme membrane anchor subunit [Steroidobacteraceae bacterium]